MALYALVSIRSMEAMAVRKEAWGHGGVCSAPGGSASHFPPAILGNCLDFCSLSSDQDLTSSWSPLVFQVPSLHGNETHLIFPYS